MVVISSLASKQILNRWKNISSFIKVITHYPAGIYREKKADFPLASKAFALLLICFYASIFIFYYNAGLSGYIMPWAGTVERIEYKSPSVSNVPDLSVIHVLKDGAVKQMELFQLTQKKIIELKIEKGLKVRKPVFYTEALFGDESLSFSNLLSDFMFFILGVLLFIFAAVTGGSFITIIYASVFMMKSKYAKK